MDIWHVSGGANQAADTHSEATTVSTNGAVPHPAVDFVAMAKTQCIDSELKTLLESPTTSLTVPHGTAHITLMCDISTGTFVPLSFR